MGEITSIATLDFETYYGGDYTLSRMTTESYVRDPRFEVIGVGVKHLGLRRWFERAEFKEWVAGIDWTKTAVLHHHAQFDGLILSHHFGVHPAYYLDTLSMARVVVPVQAGGSLKKLAEHFGIGQKGEEVLLAINKRRADFTREEWAQYGLYCLNDCDLTDKLLEILSPLVPDDEQDLIDMTVRAFTEPVLVGDQPLLEKFITDERKRKAELLARIAADRDVLMSNDKFAGLLLDMGETPPTKVSAAKSKTAGREVETFAFAKTDVGMRGLLEHEREEIRWLAEARVGVKSTINETRAERLLGCARRGPMPVYLRYAGAHTYRFSGGDKTNWQNFERGGVLRDAIRAPEGSHLVVADSGQIEARILAWVAGYVALTAQFAKSIVDSSFDIYAEKGSELFGTKISKETHPLERQVSKSLLLGLGYSMGWLKLSAEMAKGMLGSKPVVFDAAWVARLGVDVSKFASGDDRMERVKAMPSRLDLDARITHCAVAWHFVNLYRSNNKPISDFWRQMEGVISEMLKDEPGMVFGPGDCLRVQRHGIELPNGLVLRYPGLHEDERGCSYLGGSAGREVKKIYGGLLTENVVQALARIVVYWQALEIRREYGWRFVMTSHDELVYCVPEQQAEDCLENVLEQMRVPPPWAAGLPVTADGGIGQTYGEAK